MLVRGAARVSAHVVWGTALLKLGARSGIVRKAFSGATLCGASDLALRTAEVKTRLTAELSFRTGHIAAANLIRLMAKVEIA
jgi:hypothetical protein